MFHDLRYALRQLAKSPVATALATLSLTLGIGANTAIFTLLNAILLQTLPVRAPEELVRVMQADAKRPGSEIGFSLPGFEEVGKRQQVFSGMFAWFGGGISNIEANGSRYVASTTEVAGDYFGTLGVQPQLGRFFTAEEAEWKGATPAAVAVISYECWLWRYGAEPGVIGKVIRVEGVPLTIVGVAPERFRGLMIDVADEVTVPFGFGGREENRGKRFPGLTLYGRRKEGVGLAQARVQLESIWPGIRREVEAGERRIEVTTAENGSSFLRRQYRQPLLILMAMAGALLAIVCVNLASLTLARCASRKQEFAIRLALGASRWRLYRLTLVESLLLSSMGATGGLLLAGPVVKGMLGMMWSGFVPLTLEATPDVRVLLFTACSAVVTGIGFSLLPGRSLARLGQTSRSVRGGVRLHRMLIPVQIAFSLVLLAGALLFAGSLHRLRNLDAGYRNEGLLLMQMYPQAGAESEKISGRAAYFRQVVERVSAVPGVEAVSYSHMGPVLRYESKSPVTVSGGTEADAQAVFELAGPEFFRVMGMRLIAGREFTWSDGEDSPRVAVVSESLVKRLFPGESAGAVIGRRIDYGQRKGLEIVGVVNSASLWMPQSREPMAVYRALLQEPDYNSPMLDLRLRAGAEAVAPAAKEALASLGRHTALRTQTIEQRSESILLVQRMVTGLASFFAGVALLLAGIGLYGLLVEAVTARTAEIGIRTALGAEPGTIRWLLWKDVAVLVLGGAALGVPAAWAASRAVESQVYGTGANPAAIGCAALLLGLTALVATYLPVRRAVRVSPVEALRQ
ncbi:MAG: ABC transporter permease [Acidobacteria bacterium]|nr:ABC transporter permease [Acidobacteriota bacterium]